MGKLEVRPCHRSTCHGYPLAQARLQTLLALEVEAKTRQTEGKSGDPRSDPPYVCGKSDLCEAGGYVNRGD